MNPLVSIIIPCFNAENFIAETIQSVINQTYSTWELIIVNDGSTDNSLSIIEQFVKQDSRITSINKQNSGVSDSRNIGVSKSKGEYLILLDADDLICQNFIELGLPEFKSDGTIGLIHFDNQLIDEKSNKLAIINKSFEGYVLDKLLMLGGGEYIFGISSCIFKKEVLDIIGLFDIKLSNSADHDLYFKIAKHYKIKRIPEVGMLYRQHTNNMHSNLFLHEKDLLALFNNASHNKLFKSSWFKQKCFSNMYLVLAGSWWKDGKNKTKGMIYLIKSLFTYPPVLFKLIKKLI